MKKLTVFLALLITATMVYCQSAKQTYSSKSGKLAYRFELGKIESSYILFFDDFGKKQAFELESKVDGYAQKSRTIITTESIFVINYEDRQVIKFPVGADNESMEMYGGNNGGFDLGAIVNEVSGVASSKMGTAVILGQTCDVFEYKDPSGSKGKYWIYKGYLFKAEFIDEDKQHAFMEVTDFKLDVPIDKKEFEIPSGYEVTDMTQMMDQMKQMQEMYGVPDEE